MKPSPGARRIPLAIALSALAALACFRAPLRGDSFDVGEDAYLYEHYELPERIDADPAHRLILVGDAGAVLPDDPLLEKLGQWGDASPEHSTVLFLGDNIYPAGLRDSDRERDETVAMRLLQSTRAHKIFLPGNHDWGFGWNRMYAEGVLLNQQEFIESHAEALSADFEPEQGCPGPVPLELMAPGGPIAGGLTVLALDLHWWLLDEEDRPVCEGIQGTSDFVERLRAELASRQGQNVLVAAHHPIRSGGPHGGLTRGFFYDLGIAIWYRFFTAQDILEPGYQQMVEVLSQVLAEHKPLAMVAGHDHNLQVLDGGDEAELVIVSGSASKVSGVTWIEGTQFAHGVRGFIVLDFYERPTSPAGLMRIEVVEAFAEDGPVASFVVDLSRAEAKPERVAGPTPERPAAP